MDASLAQLVWQRAKGICEYCNLPQAFAGVRFEIDHIIAVKHGGASTTDNLALSCYYCNSYKGPNISGIDEKTGRTTRLFNPRTDSWRDHFRWRGLHLIGKTAIGRATIRVLAINHAGQVDLRRWIAAK